MKEAKSITTEKYAKCGLTSQIRFRREHGHPLYEGVVETPGGIVSVYSDRFEGVGFAYMTMIVNGQKYERRFRGYTFSRLALARRAGKFSREIARGEL